MADNGGKSTRRRMNLLVKYLYENTDENHPATTPELLEHLEKNGIRTNRKTLKADMDFLCGDESLFDVVEVRSKPNRYFWGDRWFELPELKLLADAVVSSRFITEKKSRQLLEKLARFAGVEDRKALDRHIMIGNRVKSGNEDIYYSVDYINDAINSGRQIRFNYEEYNAKKELVLRGDGEVYSLSPYVLYWSDDFYYVVGWSEKHHSVSNFRVDRMKNVEITEERAIAPPQGWNIDDYSKKVFEMYTGEVVSVTLECENKFMKYVVDHFGENVMTRVLDEEHFLAFPEVSLSPNFYSWVFGFGGKIRIIGPQSVRDEYIRMAKIAETC